MELRSCYFCGVAGRTVEPRSVSGVAVTLCPRCEDKLARLRDATDEDTTEATPVTFDAPTTRPTEGEERDPTDEPRAPADGVGGPSQTAPDTPSTDDPPDDAPTGSSAGEPANDADPTDDGASTGLRGLGADDRGRRSTYRKALRLLRNREFPMARSDTVDLLASAYDLDREECERLLDLCVDRGLLAEVDGELREP